MTNLNRITLLSNTGSHEPKSGSTSAGKQVTRLTMATNARYQDAALGFTALLPAFGSRWYPIRL